MKKALVSVNEVIVNFDGTTGLRICEVNNTAFEVHSSLFWIDCEDTVIPDHYYYDTETKEIKEVPQPSKKEQPVTTGTTEL